MIDYQDYAGLQALVSDEFSDWSQPLLITQEMIDQFAELSGDRLWIHTDPEKCAQMGMGSTIAHGFLVLSLLSSLRTGDDIVGMISGYKQIMNYGSDKLRFLAPVPVDSQIHARRRVLAIDVEAKPDKIVTKATLEWQVNVVGKDRPSLLYNMTFVFF